MPVASTVISASNIATHLSLQNSQGTLLGNSATDLVGFWGATPIAQPGSPAGNVHTVTAGSTTAVYVNTTFDGTIGSTAYTIGDIVIALKNAGLLAS